MADPVYDIDEMIKQYRRQLITILSKKQLFLIYKIEMTKPIKIFGNSDTVRVTTRLHVQMTEQLPRFIIYSYAWFDRGIIDLNKDDLPWLDKDNNPIARTFDQAITYNLLLRLNGLDV